MKHFRVAFSFICLISLVTGNPKENDSSTSVKYVGNDNIISKTILTGIQKIPLPNLFGKNSDQSSIDENKVKYPMYIENSNLNCQLEFLQENYNFFLSISFPNKNYKVIYYLIRNSI